MKIRLCLITPAMFFALNAYSVAAQQLFQHQASVSATQHDDYENDFLNLDYKYYFEPNLAGDMPFSIAPYLTRNSSVRISHLNLGGNNRTSVGGQYFSEGGWVLSATGIISKDNGSNFDQREEGFDLAVGYFVNQKLQLGVTREFGLLPQQSLYGGRLFSDAHYALTARYTDIEQGQGWDHSAKYYIDYDDDFFELSSAYFFNQYVNLAATYRYNDSIYRPEYVASNLRSPKHQIEISAEYWIGNQFSLKASVAQNVANNAGVESASLTATYRF